MSGKGTILPAQSELAYTPSLRPMCIQRKSAQKSRLHAICMRHRRWARRDTTSWNGRYTDYRHCDTKSGLPMFQFCCCPLRLEVKWTCACLTSPPHRPARTCHQTKTPHCTAQDSYLTLRPPISHFIAVFRRLSLIILLHSLIFIVIFTINNNASFRLVPTCLPWVATLTRQQDS